MDRSICVLISQAPYGTVHAAEGVRHVNGALSQGFQAVAVLVDDGVWVARPGQQPGASGFTSLSDALTAALKASGPVPRVAVHRPSLEARGLTAADLIAGVELVDDAGLTQIITETQFLLRF
ncbi:MAG TPA: DsrE family protein [Symbiobacteriaceae bacterium]|jgi:tRNA 2-thiouridine synthesizing protein C